MSLAQKVTRSLSSERALPSSIAVSARVAAALRNLRTARLGFISRDIDPAVYNIPRNLDIFPQTLRPVTQSKLPFEQPTLYTLSQLKSMIGRYREEDYFDSIFVSSAEYCKQSDGPQHEFLLLKVFDSRIPDISNFLVLDRTINSSGHSGFPVSTISSSGSGPAHDRVRVSGYGDAELLAKQCNLRSYKVLERLDLSSTTLSTPLLLRELVILAFETSQSRRMYDLMSAQCFWFPGCVWECMRALFPDALCVQVAKADTRGNFRKIFQQMIEKTEVDDILYKTRSEIRQSHVEFRRNQETVGRKRNKEVGERCESIRRENEMLKQEVDRLRVAAGFDMLGLYPNQLARPVLTVHAQRECLAENSGSDGSCTCLASHLDGLCICMAKMKSIDVRQVGSARDDLAFGIWKPCLVYN
ncbi:hypothetical protein BDV93DRAFT_549397 [Ceratobasidium sp. AG-I]|nr:hypothetical protein BDV93DRAFT_549397 [Ceratobasidium sp. AG-I]